MQKVLKGTPDWVKLPALLVYGVAQPFLPAALIAGSRAPIWHWVAIWRAVGWTVLLAFTIYAPVLALRSKRNRAFNLALSLIIWGVILVAAYRAGGDLWDNPRYRTAFAGLQVALVAWVWIEHRRMADNWLRRAVLAIGAVLFWFVPWYLRRYSPFEWPVPDLIKTIGLGLVTAFLLVIWDWARSKPVSEDSFLPPPVQGSTLQETSAIAEKA
jgi:CDP-diglyceride synthetase